MLISSVFESVCVIVFIKAQTYKYMAHKRNQVPIADDIALFWKD